MTGQDVTRGRPEQREAFLAGAVAHVLQEGVASLSLRPLAGVLGTSDRMLLYYFGTRDALLAAVLQRVGHELLSTVVGALPGGRVAPGALLAALWRVARSGEGEEGLRLYLEVAGLAASGREEFGAAAAEVGRGWLAWAREHVDVPDAERAGAAAGVLAALDGLLLLRHSVDEDAADEAARWWLERLGNG